MHSSRVQGNIVHIISLIRIGYKIIFLFNHIKQTHIVSEYHFNAIRPHLHRKHMKISYTMIKDIWNDKTPINVCLLTHHICAYVYEPIILWYYAKYWIVRSQKLQYYPHDTISLRVLFIFWQVFRVLHKQFCCLIPAK